jgi:hypothetical protein
MIRLRPNRYQLIEMVVLTALAVGVCVGLRWHVLTRDHMMFFAGAYATYLVWCAASDRRERSRRRQQDPLPRP